MTDAATVLDTPPAPDSAEAFRQVKVLHDAGKFAEAETMLRGAIARDPNNSDLRNARGVMFAAMNRHLDALWCYRDALALSPRAPGIWTNLGNALTQLKYLTSAITCHRRPSKFRAAATRRSIITWAPRLPAPAGMARR